MRSRRTIAEFWRRGLPRVRRAIRTTDGYLIDVPNFLGVRQFAQITAADAMRRLSMGDEDGAMRALAAAQRLRDGLRENPTLVSLMIAVAVDGLVSAKQVRLPRSEDGAPSLAGEVTRVRAEFLRTLQLEAWVALQMARRMDAIHETSAVQRRHAAPRWLSGE